MKNLTILLVLLMLLTSCNGKNNQVNQDIVTQQYGLNTVIVDGGFGFEGGNYTILSSNGKTSDYLLYNSGTNSTLYSIGAETKQKPFGVGRSFGFTPDTDVLVYTRSDLSDYAFQKANHTQEYSTFSHARVLTAVLKK
jgi:hypothetical protein